MRHNLYKWQKGFRFMGCITLFYSLDLVGFNGKNHTIPIDRECACTFYIQIILDVNSNFFWYTPFIIFMFCGLLSSLISKRCPLLLRKVVIRIAIPNRSENTF